MHHAGLILEGGGMRGVYTAGILDFFLDKEIELKKSMEFRQEAAMPAVIYPNREAGRSM